MGRFTARSNFAFGPAKADDEDTAAEAAGTPSPKMAKSKSRRMLSLREASEVLAHLPGPDESLHVLCSKRLDLSDVITHLLERLGHAERVTIATLGFNERNLLAMIGWMDRKMVGQLTLLSSIFLRANKPKLWDEALEAFRGRKQRAACCHSHAKVVCFAFADGARCIIEGSANLCGSGSGIEQFCLMRHPELHAWHEKWILDLVTRHEGDVPASKELEPTLWRGE